MAKVKAQPRERKPATDSVAGKSADGAEILAIVDRLVRRPEIAALQDEVYSIRAVARGELSGFDLSHPIEWVLGSARQIADRLTKPIGRQTRDDIERLPVLLEKLGHRKCGQCGSDFVWGNRTQALCRGCNEANLKAVRPPDTLGKLIRELQHQIRIFVDPDREPDRAMLEAICRDEYGDFDLNSVLRVRAKLVRSDKFASPSAVDNLLIADVVKWLPAPASAKSGTDGADKKGIFLGRVPSDRYYVEFVQHFSTHRNANIADIAIAREYTGETLGACDKAKRLLNRLQKQIARGTARL